jgi:hypothetical protein
VRPRRHPQETVDSRSGICYDPFASLLRRVGAGPRESASAGSLGCFRPLAVRQGREQNVGARDGCRRSLVLSVWDGVPVCVIHRHEHLLLLSASQLQHTSSARIRPDLPTRSSRLWLDRLAHRLVSRSEHFCLRWIRSPIWWVSPRPTSRPTTSTTTGVASDHDHLTAS